MYGGSGKLGRGRGGGPVKRNIHSTFQPSSVQRPSAAPGGGRLSAGGGHRSRNNTPAAPAAVSAVDESFSLVRNNPLNFGMIIRLSPVLVEEIKRLESQGRAARIKFDSSANNPAGNVDFLRFQVIDVGGKEFRFTWSQETGDLCDIYEECGSGDNGDGTLVESGGAWRKLNVQRELDESLSNQVKMRTVEAERKHKSRKAIILDHGNPSMKNQMKALAAAEVNNSWRGGAFNKKKEPPFKKMKGEPSSAVIPPKTGAKPGLPSSTPSKIRASASPILSTPEQSGVPLSPLVNRNITKLPSNREDATLTQSSKENAETFTRVPAGTVQNKQGSNERLGNKPTDLQSLIISILMEKPQGMNYKAVEKAVGETIPNSVKQIEPILKKVAVFQAPGRYILKPDFELEGSRKSLSESGSSPENNNHQRDTSLKPNTTKEFEDPSNLIPQLFEDLNTSDKIDIEHHSPDISKKVSESNQGPTATSSRSGSGSDSDSDSDSSDSGSDSGGSPKSPVGSGSDSSDSESDASSNSKQGSDEDVDIMSDDDTNNKEPKQSAPPLPHPHPHPPQYNDHISDLLFGKDLFEDDHHEEADKDGDNYENAITDDHHDTELKNTSKRGSDENENENAKRLKTGNWGRRNPSDVSDYDFDKLGNRGFQGSDSPIDLNMGAKVSGTDRHGEGQDSHIKDKRPPKNSRLGGDGIRHSGSREKKHSTSIGKGKDTTGLSIKDSVPDLKKSPIVNGRGPALRRELSDLEMGELRENLQEEPSGGKKRFEKNNSFKQQQQPEKSSDYWNLDSGKGKGTGRSIPSLESAKPVLDDDFTKVNNGKPLKASSQSSKGREAGAVLGFGSDYTDTTQRKAPQKQVGPVIKKQKGNDLGEKRKDFWESAPKRREMESCSDDSITSYTKYEKEEPEMKAPIKDLSQYNEYVQEYREKYDCYHTLNKILESYRNEFQNFGRDLELAKERDNDRYNKILEQLLESYRQCGTKHKRLKKIFIVLHHELQHLKEMIREYAEKQTKG
ncbi:hypothetical protein LXL04_008320 [Taraxacum kok-saghyz]